jgi:hypothetical protein
MYYLSFSTVFIAKVFAAFDPIVLDRRKNILKAHILGSGRTLVFKCKRWPRRIVTPGFD